MKLPSFSTSGNLYLLICGNRERSDVHDSVLLNSGNDNADNLSTFVSQHVGFRVGTTNVLNIGL